MSAMGLDDVVQASATSFARYTANLWSTSAGGRRACRRATGPPPLRGPQLRTVPTPIRMPPRRSTLGRRALAEGEGGGGGSRDITPDHMTTFEPSTGPVPRDNRGHG
eukprot:scaffold4395_cov411-Prasinococcus_capsulatus_cf.AAC.3